MKLERAKPEEAPRILEWMRQNFYFCESDVAALSNPLTQVMAVSNGKPKPVVYIPVQLVAQLDALGFDPESKPLERKEAMFEGLEQLIAGLRKDGVRELVFFSADEAMIRRAEKIGFSVIMGQALRMCL